MFQCIVQNSNNHILVEKAVINVFIILIKLPFKKIKFLFVQNVLKIKLTLYSIINVMLVRFGVNIVVFKKILLNVLFLNMNIEH